VLHLPAPSRAQPNGAEFNLALDNQFLDFKILEEVSDAVDGKSVISVIRLTWTLHHRQGAVFVYNLERFYYCFYFICDKVKSLPSKIGDVS